MKISKSSEAILQVAITDAIQHAKISEHLTISFPDEWGRDVLQKLDDGFREALSSILDGLSFDNFVKVQLRLLLLSHDVPEIKEDQKLQELELFREPLSIAKKIVAIISDLPNYYRIISPLPHDLSKRVGSEVIEIPLGDRCKIVSGALLQDEVALSHPTEAIDRQFRRDGIGTVDTLLEPSGLYFVYRTSGYINHTSVDPVLSEFNEELRSLYGLFWNQEITKNYGFIDSDIKPFAIANKVTKKTNLFSFAGGLESDVHDCTGFWTTTDFDKKLQGESLESIIEPVTKVYSASNSRKLKTAASWLFKAHVSKRSLDRAIEAAIVLEVLLGDRGTADRIGLSKLMANRCAYALGENEEKREQIISDFLEFYALRSEIVHTGRTTLTASERWKVSKGIKIASSMLADEVRRLNV